MVSAIDLRSVSKRFGATLANDAVDLQVEAGTVHALLGENGAGKTTLMNILFGMVTPDSGEIRIQGKRVQFRTPADAIAAKVGMVHQHFMIAPSLSVAENVLIGRTPSRFGIINRKRGVQLVAERAREHGFALDPRARARDLSVGTLQKVEILKALVRGAEIVILDEPTAVLTPQEADELSGTLKGLARNGTTVILITHKLREVMNTCDRATVMRAGRVVGSVDVRDTDEDRLTEMMVGRIPVRTWQKHDRSSDPALEIRGLSVQDDRGRAVVRAVDLNVPAGRIVGIAGVEGNGQTELVDALTGLRRAISGSVHFEGKDLTNRRPRVIRSAGVAHIPEDRLRRGVARNASISDNLLVTVYRDAPHSRFGLLRPRKSIAHARGLMTRFAVAAAGPRAPVGSLSGGNMQKVVVARELAVTPRLVVAAQPTRGVDVGSIEFLHRELIALRDAGVAVLLLSAELDELFALSDVLHVMYEGALIGPFDPSTSDELEIGAAMAGRPAALDAKKRGAL